jgi:hypothetical protein
LRPLRVIHFGDQVHATVCHPQPATNIGRRLAKRKAELTGDAGEGVQDAALTIGSHTMARKYSKESGRKVERALHKMKEGTLRSGRSGKKVKSRKQAIAIGLSEARRKASSRGRASRPRRSGAQAKAARSSS